ncbi:MAG: class II aldolase/adducin family protein [Caldilinea sp.]|nr:class II aldolase/adducin family protein [Caldilinea sp.]MCB0058152.1 class II aldolase/adducin family protein [Caldilineaceae bacterium]MCB9122376.1 class II aldolase/adducin family protein [Caldilineaceae bacterium]MCO5208930.1 class II aldolase/adducin family protein [Caldilinea sp.]MCW5840375.1 class II aldolase/adducin family protein [Caldilinea sp.]
MIQNQSIPDQILYIARRMFERRLTDMAGGNISARAGGDLYITPRYAGSKQHWQLEETDILHGPIATDDLFAQPRFSREGKAHLAVYREFPDVGAVIHAHPFHVLPFCVAGRAIEPVLEATQKFGVTPVVPFAPAHSADLARHVVDGLRGREASIRKQAAAVLLPKHGIIVAGLDLWAAIDALERIDWNAWCILSQSAMPAATIPYEIG